MRIRDPAEWESSGATGARRRLEHGVPPRPRLPRRRGQHRKLSRHHRRRQSSCLPTTAVATTRILPKWAPPRLAQCPDACRDNVADLKFLRSPDRRDVRLTSSATTIFFTFEISSLKPLRKNLTPNSATINASQETRVVSTVSGIRTSKRPLK